MENQQSNQQFSQKVKNFNTNHNNSVDIDVPYTPVQVEKNINYFNSIGHYDYACSLRNYSRLLSQYNNKRLQLPPQYPQFYKFQIHTPISKPPEYKRPAMYQGARI